MSENPPGSSTSTDFFRSETSYTLTHFHSPIYWNLKVNSLRYDTNHTTRYQGEFFILFIFPNIHSSSYQNVIITFPLRVGYANSLFTTVVYVTFI